MEIQLTNSPQMAIAHIVLGPNEDLSTQSGSLVAMSPTLQAQSLMRRSSDGGKTTVQKRNQTKTLFLTTFKSGEDGGELYLAPALIGNIAHYTLSKHKLIIRQSAYLASSGGIEIFMGYRSPVAGDPLTWLSLVGKGDILMSAFGHLYEIDVENSVVVSSDHLIAFENTLKFNTIPPVKNWRHWLLPPQNTLYQFKGTGRIWCQTHRPHGLARHIGQQLKPHNFKLHK